MMIYEVLMGLEEIKFAYKASQTMKIQMGKILAICMQMNMNETHILCRYYTLCICGYQ